jgi:N-acetyl-gamma-glutamyl-phosphate reductase
VGIRVAVAGASGYAGGEVLRLLAAHPQFEIAAATARSQAGAPVASVHPHLLGLGLTFADAGADAGVGGLGGADLVFLALPHGESAALARDLPAHVRVVDLGADFRLADPQAWAAYYGGTHAGTWTYGLPELPGQRDAIAASTRVAATGCYAVATILALAPLIAHGVVSAEDVVVVAASGTTGAGRATKTNLLASEVMGDVSTYKVGAHQHTPEIKQATGARTLSLTPLLVPMPRGILSTVTAVPTGARPTTVAGADARRVLRDQYEGEPFVRVLPEGTWPRTAATLGSNACHLQATVDADSGRVIVVSAIDNLGKGAAGQAIQCANLMFGLPETAGLSAIGVNP